MNRLIYNAQQASYLLGVSESTLIRLTNAKRLNKIYISSRRIGWTHKELERFITEQVEIKAG